VRILFLQVPPAEAVGTALAFGVAVKLACSDAVVPEAGQLPGAWIHGGRGGPGLLLGSAILSRLNTPSRQGLLYAALGSTIVVMAAVNRYRLWLSPLRQEPKDRSRWLPFLTFPIGAEVAFLPQAPEHSGRWCCWQSPQ